MNYLKPFEMKEFTVAHDQCAMRVNTDGCLLGAVAGEEFKAHQVQHALDIGTGSGVIAMQLAQRFDKAYVDAVEIHGPSAKQASENFSKSPYAGRMVCYHEPIQEFEHNLLYDLIVSNPPYFESGPTKLDAGIAAARHALTLDFKSLVMNASRLLKDSGQFWVILPADQSDRFLDEAMDEGLNLKNIIHVYPKAEREANRCIYGLCKCEVDEPQRKKITLYKEDQHYTEEAREVLSPFYDSL
jgi:tRNA1Val (adenine37-N6)-methyltransferase